LLTISAYLTGVLGGAREQGSFGERAAYIIARLKNI